MLILHANHILSKVLHIFLFLTKNLRLIEESKFPKFSPAKNQFSKKLECFFPHSFKICKTSPFLSRIGSRKGGRDCRQSSSLSNPLQPLLMPHLVWNPQVLIQIWPSSVFSPWKLHWFSSSGSTRFGSKAQPWTHAPVNNRLSSVTPGQWKWTFPTACPQRTKLLIASV